MYLKKIRLRTQFFDADYEEKEDKATSVMLIEPTKDIVNCLLSVSLMEDEDECLSETNIGLFLVVQDVDVSKRVRSRAFS